MPSYGSTAALFGHRDAVVLLLAAAGLPYRDIAGLDRTDITSDGAPACKSAAATESASLPKTPPVSTDADMEPGGAHTARAVSLLHTPRRHIIRPSGGTHQSDPIAAQKPVFTERGLT
ncbi:hypothetical protein QMK17_23245 [Rhodococcus sp. G-MC3]|uniref:hypothetical protein n=1 Tax=Rhodococcus sp. G-MC3 TaxID=3046209 RepID=UPI0024B88EA8|nr:hypothetical protein [Rhodococcus sp. G-MC3]MDJ0396229.1 hypothetical protein [Rhodococcus sp. G-MC3]